MTLDRKKQLNRVTNEEYRVIDHFMSARTREVIQTMKRELEKNADEWDRTAKKLANDAFKAKVEPKLLAAFKDIDQGAIPIGFKVKPGMLEHRDATSQAQMHVAMTYFSRDYTLKSVEDYARSKGYDPDHPPGDNQALEWAWRDVMDEFYDQHFP
jgi:hypothetical protein